MTLFHPAMEAATQGSNCSCPTQSQAAAEHPPMDQEGHHGPASKTEFSSPLSTHHPSLEPTCMWPLLAELPSCYSREPSRLSADVPQSEKKKSFYLPGARARNPPITSVRSNKRLTLLRQGKARLQSELQQPLESQSMLFCSLESARLQWEP